MSNDSLAKEQISSLFDGGVFTELDSFGSDSVVTGYGMVNGAPCYAFSQNVAVDGGAMCATQAEKIKKVYSLAEKTGYPIIGIFDSNGGKLSDGMITSNAYAELIAASGRISGVVPQIAVISGVCAASAAVWAQSSDIVIMAEDAKMFVTSPYILGDDIGSAKANAENGTAHLVCADAIASAREVISFLPSNNISSAPEADCIPANGSFNSNTAIDAINAVADENSAIVLRAKYGAASAVAFTRVTGMSTGIAAACGNLTADDCSKLSSFIALCDAFSIPVVTLINSNGFADGAEDEIGGISKSAAMLTKAYANATTAKVAFVIGNAFGTVFTALAGKSSAADIIIALKSAVISPIAPDAAATIIYNDRILAGEDKEAVLAEYITEYASAEVAAKLGLVDDIATESDATAKVISALDMLSSKRVSILDKKHIVLSL